MPSLRSLVQDAGLVLVVLACFYAFKTGFVQDTIGGAVVHVLPISTSSVTTPLNADPSSTPQDGAHPLDFDTWNSVDIQRCIASATPHSELAVLGLADSHGRHLLQSIVDRLTSNLTTVSVQETATQKKHRLWSWAAAVDAGRVQLINNFAPRLNSADATRMLFRWRGNNNSSSSNTATDSTPTTRSTTRESHVLLSRGGWDAELYGTPLRRVHSDITAVLLATEAWKTPVTFRLIHPLLAVNLDRVQARCRDNHTVAAYRGVAACAVARYMRDAAARQVTRVVRVLDVWDLGVRVGAQGYHEDGQHLGTAANHLATDAYLLSSVCPKVAHPSLSGDGGDAAAGVWWSSDADAIEQRFDCNASFPVGTADDVRHVGPIPIGAWDAIHGTAQEVGCMCQAKHPVARNDHCALREMTHPKAKLPVLRLFEHVCEVSRLLSAKRLPKNAVAPSFVTNLTRERLVPPRGTDLPIGVGEVLVELCANPLATVDAFLALGGADESLWSSRRALPNQSSVFGRCTSATDDADVSVWCRRQTDRLGQLRFDLVQMRRVLGWNTPKKLRALPFDEFACQDRDFWTAMFRVACHPSWRRERRVGITVGIARALRGLDDKSEVRAVLDKLRVEGEKLDFNGYVP